MLLFKIKSEIINCASNHSWKLIWYQKWRHPNKHLHLSSYLTVHIQFKVWRIEFQQGKEFSFILSVNFSDPLFPPSLTDHRLGGAWPHVIISHSDLKVCACLKLLFVTIYLLPYILAPIHLSPTLFDCQKRKFHLPVEFNPNSSTH